MHVARLTECKRLVKTVVPFVIDENRRQIALSHSLDSKLCLQVVSVQCLAYFHMESLGLELCPATMFIRGGRRQHLASVRDKDTMLERLARSIGL